MIESTKIVLLSGRGKRFKDRGYIHPKGLLKLNNQELAFLSANSLPNCKDTIFGIQKKDSLKYNFKNIKNKNYHKNSKIYEFDDYTNSQATSCFQILENNKILTDSFFVLSCDFSFEINKKLSNKFFKKLDAIVFTYKAKNYNFENSTSYGWIRSNKKNMVLDVSCKKSFKANKGNEYIIIGGFYFADKNIFKKYYINLINSNRYINNETYIDVIIELMVNDGLKIYNLKVDKFRDFGTPENFEIEKNK